MARHETTKSTHSTGLVWRRVFHALAIPLLVAALVTAGSPGWGSYVVRKGDTLSELAQRYDTTVRALRAANDLPGNGSLVYAGTSISVPVTSKAARASRATQATVAPRSSRTVRRTVTAYKRHTVVGGDSVLRLAKRYGTSARLIAKANRLRESKVVVIGRTLSIPVRVTKRVPVNRRPAAGSTRTARSTVPNTFAGRTYPNAVAMAAARNRATLSRRALPGKAQIRSMIIRTARRHGVDPSLPLAVSWQESGWNQRRVSPANAIGAMQVIPSTGAWASSVVGRRLNLLDSQDNITAGVVLLRVLTRSAKVEDAVAGYYQGLASVRRNGHFTDTKSYVRNVLVLRENYR